MHTYYGGQHRHPQTISFIITSLRHLQSNYYCIISGLQLLGISLSIAKFSYQVDSDVPGVGRDQVLVYKGIHVENQTGGLVPKLMAMHGQIDDLGRYKLAVNSAKSHCV
jgi:hypothetical protein